MSLQGVILNNIIIAYIFCNVDLFVSLDRKIFGSAHEKRRWGSVPTIDDQRHRRGYSASQRRRSDLAKAHSICTVLVLLNFSNMYA